MATDEDRASTNETLFGCDVKTTYITMYSVRQVFFRKKQKNPRETERFPEACRLH